MEFKTTLTKPQQPFELNYGQQILLLGSCFAENIGALLAQHYFNIEVNPYGIIYNPMSLASSLQEIIDRKQYTEEDVFLYQELFASFNHHGKFKSTNKEELLNEINNTIIYFNNYINNLDVLFITFGTAFVYEHIANQQVVANCHKLPSSTFNKRLLNSTEIVSTYLLLIKRLQAVRPNIKIVFTVSPVRHIKDGLIENNRSKAVLLTAVHELVEQLDACFYFPAYELLIDDLRDYRFFDSDLVHPNQLAIKYIWSYLINNYLADKSIFDLIEKYNKLKAHKLLFENTNAAKNHTTQVATMKALLQQEFPYLKLRD
ncbi:MAG: GSCFA domain-containing protein [Chitinophagales bacterium]|nr:GSCFA domain-containing protein [Chitinophagales bacterium]